MNAIVLLLFVVLAGAFVVACGWRRPSGPASCARRARAGSGSDRVLCWSSSACCSPPRSAWTYFFVMLLLPIAVAVRLLPVGRACPRPPLRRRSPWDCGSLCLRAGYRTAPAVLSPSARECLPGLHHPLCCASDGRWDCGACPPGLMRQAGVDHGLRGATRSPHRRSGLPRRPPGARRPGSSAPAPAPPSSPSPSSASWPPAELRPALA